MFNLLLIFCRLTTAIENKEQPFSNCTILESNFRQTHDFITFKVRNDDCYDAHNRPNINGPTRIAVSLFIAHMDSISENTMDRVAF